MKKACVALVLLGVLGLASACGGGSESSHGEPSGTNGPSGESGVEPARAAIAAGEELAEREKECQNESPKSTECEEVEYEAMELNHQYNQNFEEEANAKLYGKAEAEATERGEYDRVKGIERLALEKGNVSSEAVQIQREEAERVAEARGAARGRTKEAHEESAESREEREVNEFWERTEARNRQEGVNPQTGQSVPTPQEHAEEFERTHNGETENEFFANHGGDGPG
jgi:hypothetical protein